MKILLAATSTEDFSGASKCLLELASSLTCHGQEVAVLLRPPYPKKIFLL